MKAPEHLHTHDCTGPCDRQNCACYADPCPHRLARSNSFVCAFCRFGLVGPKPKQDALESAVKEVAA